METQPNKHIQTTHNTHIDLKQQRKQNDNKNKVSTHSTKHTTQQTKPKSITNTLNKTPY